MESFGVPARENAYLVCAISRLRRATLALALVALALVALFATGLPTVEAARASGDGIVSIKRQMDNARERTIADYWTKRRLRKARPLDVGVPSGESVAPARSAPRGAGEGGYLPPIDPGGGPVPRWRNGRPPAAPTPLLHPFPFYSGEVAESGAPPHTTNGKVFGFLPDFGPYECSAAAITAPNRSLVLTASHCLVEPGHPFAKRFVFVPSYREGERPFGTWVGEKFFSPSPWVERENFSFDYGAAVVRPQHGAALHDVVGARGFAFGQPREQTYDAHGYPDNRFGAQRMYHCVSELAGTTDPSPDARGPAASGIGCDMGVGASGGGWVIEQQFVTSVISFSYRNHPKILFGPYLTEKARQLVAKAGNA
jgi:hypothetical protein